MNKALGRWIRLGLFALPIGFGGAAFAQSAGDTGNSASSPSVVSPSDNANTVDKKDTLDDSRRTNSQQKAGALDDRAGMENPSSTSGSDDSPIHRSSGSDESSTTTTVKKHKHIKKSTKTNPPSTMDSSSDFKSDSTLQNDVKTPAPIDRDIP